MINDEKRRKIAKELRSESETWRDTFPDATIEEEAFGAAIMSDLMVFVGLDDESPVHAIYARLADLIDRPTCQMVECTIDHGSRSWGMRCTACGKEFEHMKPSYGWRNCPNCGAEVVE